MNLLRPTDRLAQLGPVHESELLHQVLAIPGTRLIEDGQMNQHLQLPRSTWSLDPVRAFCHASHVDPPGWWDRQNQDYSSPDLRSYQSDGVNWLIHMGGGLIGDMIGLGKTRLAAVAAQFLDAGHNSKAVVIIAPKFLRATWEAELQKIGALERPEDFHALTGTKLDLSKWSKTARYIFVHYDIVPVWWNWIWPLKPRVVIIDEAHYLKNGRTKRAQGVAAAVSLCPNRILLTGTPILNRVGEFWNLLDLAEGKWSFGTPKAFRIRYAGAYHDGFGLRDAPKPTNTDELQERLKFCYLRRTFDEVGLELPPLTRTVINVPLDEKARLTHAGFFANRPPKDLIDAILKRRASKATFELLAAIRKFTSRQKLQTTIERVRGHLDAGEDVLVFTWERAMAEKIAHDCTIDKGPARLVHGGVDSDVRDIQVAQFQAEGGCLVATLDALSVGVNLQRARIVVIHDLDWTPAKLLQAEGRVWRQGQTRPVVSEWIVVENSLDAFFVEHLVQKAGVIERALNDDQASTLADVLDDRVEDFEERFYDEVQRWREQRQGG